MHPRNQNIFIMRAVENAKFSPLGKREVMPPQIIMLFFQRSGSFKTMNHHSARIEILNNLTNQTILPSSVHSLKADQNGIFSMCIKRILNFAQFFSGGL